MNDIIMMWIEEKKNALKSLNKRFQIAKWKKKRFVIYFRIVLAEREREREIKRKMCESGKCVGMCGNIEFIY